MWVQIRLGLTEEQRDRLLGTHEYVWTQVGKLQEEQLGMLSELQVCEVPEVV